MINWGFTTAVVTESSQCHSCSNPRAARTVLHPAAPPVPHATAVPAPPRARTLVADQAPPSLPTSLQARGWWVLDPGTVGAGPLPGMHSPRVQLGALPGKGHVLGPDAVQGTPSSGGAGGKSKGECVVCSQQQMAGNRGEATFSSRPQLPALCLAHAGRGKDRQRGTRSLHVLRWGETELGQKASEEAAGPVLPLDTGDAAFSLSGDKDNP